MNMNVDYEYIKCVDGVLDGKTVRIPRGCDYYKTAYPIDFESKEYNLRGEEVSNEAVELLVYVRKTRCENGYCWSRLVPYQKKKK